MIFLLCGTHTHIHTHTERQCCLYFRNIHVFYMFLYMFTVFRMKIVNSSLNWLLTRQAMPGVKISVTSGKCIKVGISRILVMWNNISLLLCFFSFQFSSHCDFVQLKITYLLCLRVLEVANVGYQFVGEKHGCTGCS